MLSSRAGGWGGQPEPEALSSRPGAPAQSLGKEETESQHASSSRPVLVLSTETSPHGGDRPSPSETGPDLEDSLARPGMELTPSVQSLKVHRPEFPSHGGGGLPGQGPHSWHAVGWRGGPAGGLPRKTLGSRPDPGKRPQHQDLERPGCWLTGNSELR